VTLAPYNEALHNGLYATFSRKKPAGGYESGVFRYAEIDATGADGIPDGGWKWHRVTPANADARIYTGAIFVQNNDVVTPDPNKGVILVGTSEGIIARRICRFDDNATPADPNDDKNVMPTN